MFKKVKLLNGKGEWDETEHPRDNDGKFTTKYGGHTHTKENQYNKPCGEQEKNNQKEMMKLKGQEEIGYLGEYAKAVDKVINNQIPDIGHIIVGRKTPKVLQDIGLENKTMVISKDVILKLKNKHNLSIEQIKALPQKMAEPFLIMKSFTESNSVIEYIKDVDIDKKPIMISVLMKKSVRTGNNYIVANVITSGYGKVNFEQHIKKGIQLNSILYYNKKRLSNLSVNEGLQLSSIMKDLKPYNNIIRKIK